MISELAQIDVTPGAEAAFEAAVGEAVALFRAARGCRSLKLERSIETPSRYRLVVGWDSLEDHMVGFRESAAFGRWRELVSPHFAAPPQVEHVATVLDGF